MKHWIHAIMIAFLSVAAMATPAVAQQAINDFIRYRNQQKWPDALRVIREEIRSPMTSERGYLSDIRLLGLSALANYVDSYKLEPGMDDEAARYYREALDYAGNDRRRQAGIHHGMTLFYSLSSRNGQAIPYMKKELLIWQNLNDTYQVLLGYDSLASAYHDMGEMQLSVYYRRKALDIAKDYFVLGKRPTDANEWLNYDAILKKRADGIAGPGHFEELKRIAVLREAITKKYLTIQALTTMESAKMFAIAGRPGLAKAWLRKARAQWEEDRKQFAGNAQMSHMESRIQMDFVCAEAQLLYEAKKVNAAARQARRCEDAWKSSGLQLGGSTLGLLGAMYESGGDRANASRLYRASIGAIERTRSSFAVAQRVAFFRQKVSRRPYWGLIRTLTRKAAESGDRADFLAAVQATERIRARQFGELADPNAPELISTEELRTIQRGLGPDTVVLDYIVTDEAIVLNAFTADRQAAKIIPLSRDGLRGTIRRIATELASPRSDRAALERLLLEQSRRVIAPVARLIDGKKQILVLTDGALNLVPFGLWSLYTKTYRPLIALKTVRVLPSLRFLADRRSGRKRAAGGLFGLADPVYARPTQVAGVPADVIRGATRSDSFRGYFEPLPETRSELTAVSRLIPGPANTLLIGPDALESKVKAAHLSRYRYLHFATHGILGGDVPGVGEPALVLGSEKGEDGFLKASEAERLKLNAQLTVLSACNTGSGEFVQGEGVLGMSRAFLIAGSDAVLVSLWSVASKPTEDLMVRFYRHMRDGLPPDAALRHAKLEMMKLLPHPFFWAPFIIVGRT